MKIIKPGINKQDPQALAAQAKVRQVVDGLIDEVRNGGDAAVRAISERLDKWSPPSFKLSRDEIDAIIASVPAQTVADIQFAQAQIRRFADRKSVV